jgi:5-methylcytosine-specific restriction endonuclease McrA
MGFTNGIEMKPNRQQVYDKYNGHCAYCGIPMAIKDMQVDHIIPQWLCETKDHRYRKSVSEVHCHENYMPSCRSCNNYKSGNPLEAFRASVENQIEILRRDRPTFRLAERFGLIECRPKEIVFYFETL